MDRTARAWILAIGGLAIGGAAVGCGDDPTGTATGLEADTDTDADSDTDSDADTDGTTDDTGGPTTDSGTYLGSGFLYVSSSESSQSATAMAFMEAAGGTSAVYCSLDAEYGACETIVCPLFDGSTTAYQSSAGPIEIAVDDVPAFELTYAAGGYGPAFIEVPAWTGGETVSLRAPGDEVPAFDFDVVAPPTLQLIEPAFPGEGYAPEISVGSALPVTWEPAASTGELYVQLQRIEATEMKMVWCHFDPATGADTIPAEAMAFLSPGPGHLWIQSDVSSDYFLLPVDGGFWGMSALLEAEVLAVDGTPAIWDGTFVP
ncbi:MAG: hypothetical protein ABMB14_26635 [Myxococcota bacterium]